MKKIIFLKILNSLRQQPHLLKKIKIFAIIGVFGLMIAGTLVVWAGFSAFNYAASISKEVIHSPITTNYLQVLKNELHAFPKISALNCWNKAQNLVSIQPWLENSAINNLLSLRGACFDLESKNCKEGNCQQNSESGHSIKGEII